MRHSLAIPVTAGLAVLVTAAAVAAHDLFLKPVRFFLAPNSHSTVHIINGNFTDSEAAVTWDRVTAASIVSPAGTTQLTAASWHTTEKAASLELHAGDPGTYAVGVSTMPRVLGLEADAFNQYLASDGVPDILEARRRDGQLGKAVRERYSKHVKTLVQVGDARTAQFGTVFGYPAELVPLENPYALKAGGVLAARALVDGQPVANQFVVAGGRTPNGQRLEVQQVRTDADGVARIQLRSAGQYYVKFIHMVPVTAEADVDYESKWATLTFEIR